MLNIIYFFHLDYNYVKDIIKTKKKEKKKKRNLNISKSLILKKILIKKIFNIFHLIYLSIFV